MAWRNNDGVYAAQQDHELKNQDEIGWSQFLQGCLTIDIRTSQQMYLDVYGKSNNPVLSAGKATVAVIVAIWQCVVSLWKKRNEHANEKQLRKTPLMTENVQCEMQHLYKK